MISATMSRRSRPASTPCTPKTFGDDLFGRHPRDEAAERILKDDLHVAPQMPRMAPPIGLMRRSRPMNTTGPSECDQPQ